VHLLRHVLYAQVHSQSGESYVAEADADGWQEIIYVLEGELTIQFTDSKKMISAGSSISKAQLGNEMELKRARLLYFPHLHPAKRVHLLRHEPLLLWKLGRSILVWPNSMRLQQCWVWILKRL
jgi:hypothetical protein